MKHSSFKATVCFFIVTTLTGMHGPVEAGPSLLPGNARNAGALGTYKQSSFYDLQKGSRLADDGFYDKAVPYFESAVEKDPTSIIAQYNLGYCLMQSALETVYAVEKQKKLESAEWAFQRASDLNPELSLAYYRLGKLAIMREDYQTAIGYYTAGVQNLPDNVGLRFNLAAAYEKLRNFGQAERIYLEVIGLNPNFVYAHNNLALLYEQNNQPEKAEALYREAIRQVPSYNYARLNLGSLLQGAGRLDEAEILYQEAARYEPDNPWVYLYLGNIYYRKGSYEEALSSYNKAISLNPDYPTTYYLASLALQKLNRMDEALANGLHYIHLAPDGAFSQEAGDLVMTLQQTQNQATGIQKP